eukprot:s2492_g7.t1
MDFRVPLGCASQVLKVEPENREAQQRCAILQQHLTRVQEDVTETDPPLTSPEKETIAPEGPEGPEPLTGQGPSGPSGATELEDEDEGVDHASTAQLISSAAEYMQRGDYASALQIYSYARKTCRSWESPAVELKALSNSSLCLQNLRGRLPELVQACNDTLRRIREIREDGWQEKRPKFVRHWQRVCHDAAVPTNSSGRRRKALRMPPASKRCWGKLRSWKQCRRWRSAAALCVPFPRRGVWSNKHLQWSEALRVRLAVAEVGEEELAHHQPGGW